MNIDEPRHTQGHSGTERGTIMVKEAPDYTASGVNLCNPDEVKEQIELLQGYQEQLRATREKISSLIPEELTKELDWFQWNVNDITKAIRLKVEEHGGYQDIKTETYALFQTRRTAEYHAQPFMERYEQAVPMVIENAINATALKGLIKGGMLSQDDLEEHGVIGYKETEAFILKIPDAPIV